MHIVPVLGRPRQENHEFEVSLGYMAEGLPGYTVRLISNRIPPSDTTPIPRVTTAPTVQMRTPKFTPLKTYKPTETYS